MSLLLKKYQYCHVRESTISCTKSLEEVLHCVWLFMHPENQILSSCIIKIVHNITHASLKLYTTSPMICFFNYYSFLTASFDLLLVFFFLFLFLHLQITHMEMIKGIQGHGYYDELVVPIIENTAHENELTGSLAKAVCSFVCWHL